MKKGSKWFGNEEDKDKFLKKIITVYLPRIGEDNIFIYYDDEEGEQSLFDISELGVWNLIWYDNKSDNYSTDQQSYG